MLTKLKIKNFKPFGEIDSVRLAPITLIYGPNSAGKSSVIQSLLLMSQTLNGRLPRNQSDLITKGGYIDLGNFASVIHNHDTKKNLEFEYELFDPNEEYNHGPVARTMQLLRVRSIFLRFSGDEKLAKNPLPILSGFGFKLYNGDKDSLYYKFDLQKKSSIKNSKSKAKKTDLLNSEDSEYESDRAINESLFAPSDKEAILEILEILEEYYEFENATDKWKPSKKTISESAKNDELINRKEAIKNELSNILLLRDRLIFNSDQYLPTKIETNEVNVQVIRKSPLEILPKILRAINKKLEKSLGGLSYLGPLRSHPARHYSIDGLPGNTVGAQGEQVVQILYNDMRQKGKMSILTRLNSYCSEFEIPYSFDIKNIGDEVTGDILVLTLIDTRTLVRVGPTDVGFGIGQLLPILIEGLLIKEQRLNSRIVCVEQPEIHLHPRLQAHLADFFIDTSCVVNQIGKTRRPYRTSRSGMQWILETHSEALMVRIQRSIREKKISHKDVSVLYVDPQGEKGSKILELRLDEDGEFIDLWPDGFFVDSLADMMGGR